MWRQSDGKQHEADRERESLPLPSISSLCCGVVAVSRNPRILRIGLTAPDRGNTYAFSECELLLFREIFHVN